MELPENLSDIISCLDDHTIKMILLRGEHGSGKTWLARELHDAVKKAKVFRHVIWLPLAKESDFDSLCQMIDRQINLQPISEEEQKEDYLETGSIEFYEKEKKIHLLSVKQNISTKLKCQVRNAADVQNCELTLIFLDNMKEEHLKGVIDEIYNLVDEKKQSVLKFLITSDKSFQAAVGLVKKEFVLVPPEKPLYPVIEETRAFILHKYLPEDKQTDQTGANVNYSKDDVAKNCYWHCRHLFNKHGSIHYNELIAHWMIEGYLGSIQSIKEAYRKGHDYLMNMVREGDLEQKEPNKVGPTSRTMAPETAPRRYGYLRSTSVGLVEVFDDGELHMLGGIVPVGGMIRTLRHDRADKRCNTLLLADNHLNRQVLQCFGNSLKCLAYFNPRSIILPHLLSKVKNISVLVLRGCDFNDSIADPISELELLTVLEISGKSSVECLRDDFFSKLVKLRTLNLSGLPLKSLPKSSSDLVDLQWLVLKGCYRLSNLPSVKNMVRLEVIDGAFFSKLVKLRTLNLSGLPIKSLPKSFSGLVHLQWLILKGCYQLSHLPSVKNMVTLEVMDLNGASSCVSKMGAKILDTPLQILDLSHTRFKITPKLLYPKTLTRMLLRGCHNLRFLRSAQDLSNLQVLDVSGAKQMRELSLENKKELVSLDLSDTGLRALPSEFVTLGNLVDLNLSRTGIKDFSSLSVLMGLQKLIFRDYATLPTFPDINLCTQLEVIDFSGCEKVQVLPDMTHLGKLKVLHLSDCESLDFSAENNDSFLRLSCLQSLNLSGTNFANVSALHSLTTLEILSLRGLEVDDLDGLTSLTRLKELYINDLRLLQESKWDFLGHLEHLQILNLSSTSIKSLPSLSKLNNSLEQLILANCSFLETVPDLKALTLLQVLDLSNTEVKIELFAHAPESLQKLSIKDCVSVEGLFPLKGLNKLELLDLSGSNVRGFSDRMDGMTNMKSLWLSEKIEIRVIPLNRKDGSSEVLFWDQSNLSKPCEIRIKGRQRPAMFAIGNHAFRVHGGTALPWESYIKQLHYKSLSGERDKIDCFCEDEFVFNNSKSWESQFPTVKLQGMSLEIHGCSSYPEDTECSIQRADNVAVIGSSFITNLSDLRLQDGKAFRVAYFSNCANMKCAFKGKCFDGQSVMFPESLVLWNLVNLESLFVDIDEEVSIESLKNIYIDCCPMLQTAVNHRSQKQQLVNLESVQIKFCENLESVFEKGDDEVSLENVSFLDLFGLPKLREVGTTLPSLQTLRVGQCPRIENLNKLFASSDQLTENLKVLQIVSCDGLVTLFENDVGSSSSPVLPNLQTLHLSDLPRLRTINAHFPSLQTLKVDDCPLLKPDRLGGISLALDE